MIITFYKESVRVNFVGKSEEKVKKKRLKHRKK
jgi:hypothetical protein